MSDMDQLLATSPSGVAHQQLFAAPIAGSPLFCEMAAPPSSSLRPGRAALLGSLRLREEPANAVPFSGKRPKMTPVGRFTFGASRARARPDADAAARSAQPRPRPAPRTPVRRPLAQVTRAR
jgi:hypothetical protein